jgi:nucleoside-diphosphate-sugar epimerase
VKRINEIPETVCDSSKANRNLGWSPQFSFEEGIRHMKENRQ